LEPRQVDLSRRLERNVTQPDLKIN